MPHIGYCFGGPFVLDLAATDDVVAGSFVVPEILLYLNFDVVAFAHPAFVTDEQFKNIKSGLLQLQLLSVADQVCAQSLSSSRVQAS